MTIEIKNNGILIYSTIKGYLVQRFYIGYTKKQAIQQFKREFMK